VNREKEKSELQENDPGAEIGYSQEEDEGLYGWNFHKGPLFAALILTILFYVFVFMWVD